MNKGKQNQPICYKIDKENAIRLFGLPHGKPGHVKNT